MSQKTENFNNSLSRKYSKTHQNTLTYELYNNLYLNITNQCSSDCNFCIRNFSNGVFGHNLWLTYEPSVKDIIFHLNSLDLKKYKEIVFTGFGEPTMRFTVLIEVIKWLYDQNLTIRLDTNGHAALINPGVDVVSELKRAGLSSVSVSLNTQNENLYNKYSRPLYPNSYSSMLKFAQECINSGIKTRLTVVDIPEIDLKACERMAKEMGATFYIRHFS